MPTLILRRFLPTVLFLVAVCSAESATLRVPADYPTILAALDATASGDTVLVSPGTYTASEMRIYQFGGPVQVTANGFLKPGVTLISEGGAGSTTIDATQPSTDYRIGLFIMNAMGPSVVVDGFTITSPVRGIEDNFSAKLIVRNCRFDHCRIAIELVSAHLAMESCQVVDCGVSGSSGKAIVGSLGGDMDIRDCSFERNVDGAIGHNMNGTAYEFRASGCLFVDNAGRTSGAIGIGGWEGSQIVIESNVFLRNTSRLGNQGSGAVHITRGHGSIRFNVFACDSARAPASGGGLCASLFDGEITNNTFWKCHTDPPYPGAAIAASSPNGVEVEGNIVAGSTGGVAAYVNASQDNVVLPGCNNFWGNQGGNYSGGFNPWPQSPTDFFSDPMFCDSAIFDFSLMVNSPCAPGSAQGCGLVGALNVGCGAVSIEAMSWGGIKALYR